MCADRIAYGKFNESHGQFGGILQPEGAVIHIIHRTRSTVYPSCNGLVDARACSEELTHRLQVSVDAVLHPPPVCGACPRHARSMHRIEHFSRNSQRSAHLCVRGQDGFSEVQFQASSVLLRFARVLLRPYVSHSCELVYELDLNSTPRLQRLVPETLYTSARRMAGKAPAPAGAAATSKAVGAPAGASAGAIRRRAGKTILTSGALDSLSSL